MSVTSMFTWAVSHVRVGDLAGVPAAEQQHRGHELVARNMLAYILGKRGELERFAGALRLPVRQGIELVTERRPAPRGGHLDHEIVDTSGRLVAVVRDRIATPSSKESKFRALERLQASPVEGARLVVIRHASFRRDDIDHPATTTFSWNQLCERMSRESAHNSHLWASLSHYVGYVGASYLQNLGAVDVLDHRSTAEELRSALLTAQRVPPALAESSAAAKLSFSVDPSTPEPLLAWTHGRTGWGLVFEVGRTGDPLRWTPSGVDPEHGPRRLGVGWYPRGDVDPALVRHLSALDPADPDHATAGIRWGQPVSEAAAASFSLLSAVFMPPQLRARVEYDKLATLRTKFELGYRVTRRERSVDVILGGDLRRQWKTSRILLRPRDSTARLLIVEPDPGMDSQQYLDLALDEIRAVLDD